MHIITLARLREFWAIHPEAQAPLTNWHKIVKTSEFSSFQQLRETFPSADLVNGIVVFNIGGNNYRLLAAIHFNTKKVFIRAVLTHAEYSRMKL